ncbi:hypothetical protein PR003_g22041 [Phytophthora rubi]|uniref:Uncharacterized protein n=1 Tax=Phytophthora rubi TaxID=129364 RepID=A0A6A3JE26_9STRA|nr:hypothetical protein PR002_g21350 [Phytophthora rubi]KAE9000175.1 hypothetical protein PR001_g18858 [Phytophthora rubi]KAE9303297.1 hypothetical protein PR003_g22041 [Phytophthora rubi]
MNGNMPMDVNGMGMMDYGMGGMPMMPGADPTGGFMDQLQDGDKAMMGLDASSFDLDLANKTQNRNRGNYRCSKCGEPKKGHVCPLVPSNYKCNRCGLSKKSCTCSAPSMRTIGVQVEMDEDMTTRVLDLSVQGVAEFHKTVVGYSTPPNSS